MLNEHSVRRPYTPPRIGLYPTTKEHVIIFSVKTPEKRLPILVL